MKTLPFMLGLAAGMTVASAAMGALYPDVCRRVMRDGRRICRAGRRAVRRAF